jgi:putative ABC transport system permease protein
LLLISGNKVFLRLLYQSFRRQQRRKLLAGIAVMLGVAVTTAMMAVGVNVGDKINRELRSYGANIVVYPEDTALIVHVGDQQLKPASSGAHLKESDLTKMKGIFWGHNILAFAPMLETQSQVGNRTVPVVGTYFKKALRYGTEDFTAGVEQLYPWWKIDGTWPSDDGDQVLLGSRLAAALDKRPGDTLPLSGTTVRIAGLVSTGGNEDSEIIVPLSLAQRLANAPNAVDKIYVSALTKPEDAFARRDPDRLSPADRDRWYCSPYANSIAYQLREIFPGSRADQIRQAAQNEGTVLSHISGMMLLIAVSALFAAALAVSAAMATTILERRQEVGLMKSLGATSSTIAILFVTEASLLALVAGLLGFGLGDLIAHGIGSSVFNSAIGVTPVLLPIVIFLALLVTVGGSAAAIRRALRLDPVMVLRGDA